MGNKFRLCRSSAKALEPSGNAVTTGSAIRFGGPAAGRESESGSFQEYRNASRNDDENSKAMKA
jgi:hypothetical protein